MLWSRCGDVAVAQYSTHCSPPQCYKHLYSVYSDYSNFKSTNQVEGNKGSTFLFFIVTSLMGSIVGHWPLVPGSIGTLIACGLNGHCPINFSAVV